MTQQVKDAPSAERPARVAELRPARVAGLRNCDLCGAIMHVHLDTNPHSGWGQVWICRRCLRTVSADEIERQAQEIALRGVPLDS
jgi:hypothetical protein